MPPFTRNPRFHVAAVVAIVLGLFLPAVNAEEMLDDGDFLATMDEAVAAWTDPASVQRLRSVATTARWLTSFFAPHHLEASRVVNLAAHVAVVLLAMLVLASLGIPGWQWIALCFGVHPVVIQPVVWAANLPGMLAAVFFMVALVAALKAHETGQLR